MKKNLLSITLLLLNAIFVFAQPKSEIRAVWLTTNGGSDWPKQSYGEKTQKENLCIILDKLAEANFNTIIFQTQVKGDVLWDSEIQPAMLDVTGNGDKSLSYNVCDFVIEECHKRNMECHAWIIPYRVGSKTYGTYYSGNKVKHVTESHPELCVSFSGEMYIDPALPEGREYLLNLYRELITKHKFDGTNFDYTRYPGSGFDDAASYKKYGNGMNKDDWRRQNINTFVHEFYDMAKSINPDIKVGAAPIGTYKNVAGYGNMTAYGSVYQDACEWMQAEKQDILVPQMYWNEQYGFSPNMTTWVDNAAGRQLVVGLAPYKMIDGSNNWEYTVVTDQIEKVRAKEGMSGVCFFRTDHVIKTTNKKIGQLYNALKTNYFEYPANIVPMDYNGVTKPNKPVDAMGEYKDGTYTVRWTAPAPDSENTAIKYYCVYASESPTVDITDIKNCVGFYIKDTEFSYASDKPGMNFVVTAFDKNYYESDGVMIEISGVEDSFINSISFSFRDNKISVKAEKGISDVTLYSAAGAMVKSEQVNSTEAYISCDDLSNGIYIVKAKYDNGTVSTHKIIR